MHVRNDIFHVTDNPTVKIRTSYKATVVVIAVFLCSVVLLLSAYKRWHLELRLFLKDHFGNLEDGNMKIHMFACKILLSIHICQKCTKSKHIKEVVTFCPYAISLQFLTKF